MSFDNTTVINRIIAVLKANTSIFTDPPLTGKLRMIHFGEDDGQKHDLSLPYALVTTENRPFVTKNEFGTDSPSSSPQTLVQYSIKVFVRNGDPQKAEEELYFFLNEIVTTLRNNPTLTNPSGGGDPKCTRSLILDTPHFVDKRGFDIQGAFIVFQCELGTPQTVDLPGLPGIALINKGPTRDFELFDNRFDDTMDRVGVDYIGRTRSFFGEIQATDARITQLQALKTARNTISVTIPRGEGTETVNCKLVSISDTFLFAGIETVIFQLEIFT